jgi:hypothetical protein
MDTPKRRGRPRKVNPSFSDDSQEIADVIESSNFDFSDINDISSEGNFNPLDEPVIHRDYSSPEIQQGFVPDLEEPKFHKVRLENQATPNSNQGGGQNFASQEPVNPAMNELSDREKSLAAKQLAESALDAYETLKKLSVNFAKIKERNIKKLYDTGKISREQRIQINEQGDSVTLMDFTRNFNEQIQQLGEPDPAFRKTIMPPLVREFEKRGMGMSDMQLIAFATLKDISVTAVGLYSANRTFKEILQTMIENNPYAGQEPKSPPPPPKPSSPTPPPSSPIVEEPMSFEQIVDEEAEYYEKIQAAMRERERMAQAVEAEKQRQEDEGITKMKIEFDDNPLREKVVRDYPAPHVEEHFVAGGEIIDEPQNDSEENSKEKE